jgi:hypothetical protein
MENQGIVFWTETGERWFLATPAVAGKYRGRRFLRGGDRRGVFGLDEAGDATGPVPASATPEDIQHDGPTTSDGDRQ